MLVRLKPTNRHPIPRAAPGFFQSLFTQEELVDPAIITDCMQSCIDADMNANFCAPFSEKEISDALFQISPLKAPGPDGFPARFFAAELGFVEGRGGTSCATLF
jgi:hypothetical protein